MQLAELMATEIMSVGPDATVAEAAQRMIDRETGVAVVLDGGELVGVISERDLLRVVSEGLDRDTPVSERMTRHVQTGSASMGLAEALALMTDGHFRHLPIVDGGRVIGMVSMRDLMAWTSLRLRGGQSLEGEDDMDTAELVASIHRMRTGAN
jgi:CBS domain-containing protein